MVEAKKSFSNVIASNFVLIIAIILMAVVAAAYFIKEPIPAAVVIRTAFGLAFAFSFIVAIIAMLQRHALNIVKRVRGEWQYSIITIVSTLAMFILGLVQTIRGPVYLQLYAQIVIVSTIAVMATIAFSIIAMLFTRVRTKSAISLYVVVLIFISFLTFSPLGPLIFPPVVDFGQFIVKNLAGAADAVYWIAAYVGAAVLLARVIMLKEKLKPRS